MRPFIPIILLCAVACADGTGPVLAPCASTPDASQDLCGNWAAIRLVPGASLQLDIRLHGDSLFGTGAYSLEAGRSGTLSVTGHYTAPAVTMTLSYDYGATAVFTGQVTAGQEISGSFGLAGKPGSPITFAPR